VQRISPARASDDPLILAFGFVDGLLPNIPHCVHCLPARLLGLPDALVGSLLDVTYGLIRLALGAQSVVAGQYARR
jgi:hypothetical protein